MKLFHYVILIPAFLIKNGSGMQISLTGSAILAEVDHPFTLTCTVFQAQNLVDDINFYREIGIYLTRVVTLQQNASRCTVLKVAMPAEYISSCGVGTNTKWTKTKQYMLMIKAVEVNDSTEFFCGLKYARIRSNVLKLKFQAASVDLSGSSLFAIKNQAFTFTCTVSQAKDLVDEIRFYMEKHKIYQVVALLKQTLNDCSVVLETFPHQYHAACDVGTSDARTFYNKYLLLIRKVTDNELTDWFCGLKFSKIKSKFFALKYKIDGSWTEWRSFPGECRSSCVRLLILNRSCERPGPVNDKIVACKGPQSVTRIEYCPGDICGSAKAVVFDSTQLFTIAACSVCAFILLAGTFAYLYRRSVRANREPIVPARLERRKSVLKQTSSYEVLPFAIRKMLAEQSKYPMVLPATSPKVSFTVPPRKDRSNFE